MNRGSQGTKPGLLTENLGPSIQFEANFYSPAAIALEGESREEESGLSSTPNFFIL